MNKIKKKLFHFLNTQDQYFLIPLSISLFTVLLIIILILIFLNLLPPKLPLFYSMPWGDAQLISKQQLFLLPIVLLVIVLINSFIVSQLHPLQKVLKRLLMLSLIFIDLIILATFLKILSIFL